jgi:hypothetical protein
MLMIETTIGAIKLIGQEDYVDRVKNALLRAQKSDYGYRIINTYIKRIEEGGPPSGMRAYINPPTFTMSRKVAFANSDEECSIIWCASCIAHDSYHSMLYHEYAKENNKNPYSDYSSIPADIWTGTGAEIKCMNHQKKFIDDIDGPHHITSHLIHYLDTLDGEYHRNVSWGTPIRMPGFSRTVPIPDCLFDDGIPDL